MNQRLLDIAIRDDLPALGARFARDRRLQIRDVLTPASAETVQRILAQETPWGLASNAGADTQHLRREALAAMPAADHQARNRRIAETMASDGGYGFSYSCYPILEAYGRWDPDGPHDMLLEYINDRPLMDLVRTVTGIAGLRRADAQATLYAPGQFLAMHDDGDAAAGRRVAYVLSLCPPGWRPDWGGYLQFYDEDGDVTAGYRPRFNTLNLFAVPQRHNVTLVAPYAPVGRYAITGWFLDS